MGDSNAYRSLSSANDAPPPDEAPSRQFHCLRTGDGGSVTRCPSNPAQLSAEIVANGRYSLLSSATLFARITPRPPLNRRFHAYFGSDARRHLTRETSLATRHAYCRR